VKNRVYVKDYGSVAKTDVRLWPAQSIARRKCKLHWLAASKLIELSNAWPGDPILICGGHRSQRYYDRATYDAEMIRSYRSVEEGRKWIDYSSDHETGLAMDIGSHGLWPTRRTALKQRKTDLYAWLIANAENFGWVNYAPEPWHWELPIDRELWELAGPEIY
jgi:hypothetical protein